MADGLAALLWDVDGTLAETELEGHRPAFNAAFADLGLPWHWDGPTYLRLLSVSGGRERMAAWFRQREGVEPPPQLLDALVERKRHHYAARVRGGALPLRPGVAELIREAAAAGLGQAIVTTSGHAAVQDLADGSLGELASAFRFRICGEDVRAKKPDPEAYLLARERLGLPAHRVLVLEDSRNGLEAALAAGLPVLITRSSLSRAEPAEAFVAARAVVEALAAGDRARDGAADDGEGGVAVLRGPACPEPRVTLSYLQSLASPG